MFLIAAAFLNVFTDADFIASLLALLIVIAVSLTSFYCVSRTRRADSTQADTVAVLLQMENTATDLSRDVDTLSQRGGEHARRIAWLEARVRERLPLAVNTSSYPQAINEEALFIAPAAPTITERRHRVLTLARRGKDSNAIAQTLGMSRAEVELIINLNFS